VKRFVEIQPRRPCGPAGDRQRQVIKNMFYNGCQYYFTIPVFYIIKCTSKVVERQVVDRHMCRSGLEPDAGGLMPMVADLLSPAVDASARSAGRHRCGCGEG